MAIIDDNKLIFLISQPRTGSSMLQQLLIQSPRIESVPEPWFLLSLVHILKEPGIVSGYNPNYAVINTHRYLKLSGVKDDYLKFEIKELAKRLYSLSYFDENNYFLDKTPRYYHIIDELYDIFPTSKFIFLARNPISVFSSILSYNFNGNLEALLNSPDRIDDLCLAPRNIAESISKYKNNCFVKYEEIVLSPEKELCRIFKYLNIQIPKNLGSYTTNKYFQNTLSVDTKSLHKFTKPQTLFLDSWKEKIESDECYFAIEDMLKKISPSTLKNLGYNYNSLKCDLNYHYTKLKS